MSYVYVAVAFTVVGFLIRHFWPQEKALVVKEAEKAAADIKKKL